LIRGVPGERQQRRVTTMLESTLESNVERPLLGQPSDELALRVSGGPRDGHVVRLASPRCSVGSSDRCTLRLRGPGIRPLHCVILRGAERTVVRRWSPDTLLNGRDFADAPLSVGDQLTIGPILFEIVAADSVSSPPAALRDVAGELPSEPNFAAQQELDRRLEELTLRQAELDARAAELDASARRLDQREAEILARENAGERESPIGEDQYRSAADAIYGGVEPADQIAAPADEIGFEAVAEEAPLSAAAVLRRLGADAPADDEGDSLLADVAPSNRFENFQPVPPASNSGGSNTPAAAGDDDEESVENYMARLMERVGLKQSGLSPAPQPIKRPSAPKPAAAPLIQTVPHAQENKPKLRQMARRPAPELSADLSRMRELANENVRTVLDSHFRRKLYYMTIGKASVAAAALLAGLLLWLWSKHGAPLAFYLATISFIVSVIWMLQYAIAVGYLIRGRSKSDGTSRGGVASAAAGASPAAAESPAAGSVDATPQAATTVPEDQVAAYPATPGDSGTSSPVGERGA
jgi:Inner membrane component of T3SS, cytoplasmic domain